MRKLKQIDELLSVIEKHLTTLSQKTNNNEIGILADCVLALADAVRDLHKIEE